MDVKELIDRLRQLDEDDEVVLTDGWGDDYFPIRNVIVAVGDDRVRRVVLND